MHLKKVKIFILTTMVTVIISGMEAQALSLFSELKTTASAAETQFTIPEEDDLFSFKKSSEKSKKAATSAGVSNVIGTVDEEAEAVLSAGAGDIVVVAPEDMDEPSGNEEEEGGGFYGYTNLGIANVEDHLNVRASADDTSKIVGKMSENTACEIVGFEGNKAHIISGSVEGYVNLDYLLTGPTAIIRANSIIQNLATVKADGLKLREQPSTDGNMISMVAYGEELPIVEENNGWVKVRYDDSTAYVSSDFVTVDMKLKTALNMSEFLYGSGVSDVRVELSEYAKQFVGNPYVWGGVSLTKGADCSGFTLSIYKKYGISLPHSSRAQANMGTSIKMSEAKPGDLVFYSKGGRINHVAIYIGGGQVCHASSKKTGIRITSAYYRTPVKVVRLLQD